MRAPRLTREANSPGVTTNVVTDDMLTYIKEHDTLVNDGWLTRSKAYNIDNQWSDAGVLGYRYLEDGSIQLVEVELFDFITTDVGRKNGLSVSQQHCFAVVVALHNGVSTKADVVGMQPFNVGSLQISDALAGETVDLTLSVDNDIPSPTLNEIGCNVFLSDELNPQVLLAKLKTREGKS